MKAVTHSFACLLGLGLGWLGAAEVCQAWSPTPVPIRFNHHFDWRFDIKVGPQFEPPSAPWYMYFPAGAGQMQPQGQAFPNWPTDWSNLPQQPGPLNQTFQPFPGFSPAPQPAPWTPASYQTPGQPMGFVPAQIPSYWYSSRR